jgi:hypothetical protein
VAISRTDQSTAGSGRHKRVLLSSLGLDECASRLESVTVTGRHLGDWTPYARGAANDHPPFRGSVDRTAFRVKRFGQGNSRSMAEAQGRFSTTDRGTRIDVSFGQPFWGIAVLVVVALAFAVVAAVLVSSAGGGPAVLTSAIPLVLGLGVAVAAPRQWRSDVEFLDRTLRETLQATEEPS